MMVWWIFFFSFLFYFIFLGLLFHSVCILVLATTSAMAAATTATAAALPSSLAARCTQTRTHAFIPIHNTAIFEYVYVYRVWRRRVFSFEMLLFLLASFTYYYFIVSLFCRHLESHFWFWLREPCAYNTILYNNNNK